MAVFSLLRASVHCFFQGKTRVQSHRSVAASVEEVPSRETFWTISQNACYISDIFLVVNSNSIKSRIKTFLFKMGTFLNLLKTEKKSSDMFTCGHNHLAGVGELDQDQDGDGHDNPDQHFICSVRQFCPPVTAGCHQDWDLLLPVRGIVTRRKLTTPFSLSVRT